MGGDDELVNPFDFNSVIIIQKNIASRFCHKLETSSRCSIASFVRCLQDISCGRHKATAMPSEEIYAANIQGERVVELLIRHVASADFTPVNPLPFFVFVKAD